VSVVDDDRLACDFREAPALRADDDGGFEAVLIGPLEGFDENVLLILLNYCFSRSQIFFLSF
jgi:hypothetical protein